MHPWTEMFCRIYDFATLTTAFLLPQGSLSTDGTEAAMGASPWQSSYGQSPGGLNGVMGMSWAPEPKLNGFLHRSQSEPGGGSAGG